MGWVPKDGAPIRINGAFHVSTNVIRFVVASAAEAELGALFHNCQTGIIFRSILEDMGHPQPRTPVHCDNAAAVSIANQTVKRQRSRSNFFGLATSARKICTHFTGTRVKRTWLITRANTIQAHTILRYALGICTNLILRENYHAPFDQAL